VAAVVRAFEQGVGERMLAHGGLSEMDVAVDTVIGLGNRHRRVSAEWHMIE
jgi:hypothetical protein